MNSCPSPEIREFDITNFDCAKTLSVLLECYYAVVSGNQRVQVRHSRDWVIYNNANSNDLLKAYLTLRSQCPAGAMFPDINPANSVERGAPATFNNC